MTTKGPWHQKPLDEWSIVGMNHYHVKGERRLFVAMTRKGQCIQDEGKDDQYLWNRLWHKAAAIADAERAAARKHIPPVITTRRKLSGSHTILADGKPVGEAGRFVKRGFWFRLDGFFWRHGAAIHQSGGGSPTIAVNRLQDAVALAGKTLTEARRAA